MPKTPRFKVKWIHDRRVELELDELGAKYEPRFIKVVDLKVEESKMNNARLGQAIDQDTVANYAVAMENDKPFPAIVCTPTGFVLDGNHRLDSAILCDQDEVLAYVVTNATKRMREIIIRTFNAAHGRPLSTDERMQHAVHLHLECGLSILESSKQENLKFDDVRKAVSVTKTRGLLEDLGVDSSKIHRTGVVALRGLAADKDVLKTAAQLVAAERLTVAEINDLCSKIEQEKRPGNKAQTKAKIAVITDWRSKIVNRRDRSGPYPQRTKLFRLVETDLPGIINKAVSLNDLGIKTEVDRLALQKAWRAVRSVMDGLFSDAKKKSRNQKS